MIMRHSLIIVFAGIGIGLCIAFAVTSLLENMLYQVKALDLPIFSAAAALLVIVAIGASLIPAHRASALVPNEVLREG
jgi:ABC-type antimicrobial peptide transport system permease subunit